MDLPKDNLDRRSFLTAAAVGVAGLILGPENASAQRPEYVEDPANYSSEIIDKREIRTTEDSRNVMKEFGITVEGSYITGTKTGVVFTKWGTFPENSPKAQHYKGICLNEKATAVDIYMDRQSHPTGPCLTVVVKSADRSFEERVIMQFFIPPHGYAGQKGYAIGAWINGRYPGSRTLFGVDYKPQLFSEGQCKPAEVS